MTRILKMTCAAKVRDNSILGGRALAIHIDRIIDTHHDDDDDDDEPTPSMITHETDGILYKKHKRYGKTATSSRPSPQVLTDLFYLFVRLRFEF